MKYFILALKKYAEFSGRATRTEYWMFYLDYCVVIFIIFLLDFLLLDTYPVLTLIVSLALFVPSLAVLVRRLHDTNRSGWWWFISLIPIVGMIILIVFLAQKTVSAEIVQPVAPASVATDPAPAPAPIATTPETEQTPMKQVDE